MNGWVNRGDLAAAGDFMGLGYDQVIFFNRKEKIGQGRVMIVDFKEGKPPGRVHYFERWGDSNVLNGWLGKIKVLFGGRIGTNTTYYGRRDFFMVGNYLKKDHSQMFLNNGPRVSFLRKEHKPEIDLEDDAQEMIVSFKNGPPPKKKYRRKWT